MQGASVGIVARPDLFHNISLSAISFATVGQMLRFRRKWRSLANLIEAFIQSFSNHFARPPRRNIMEKKKKRERKKERRFENTSIKWRLELARIPPNPRIQRDEHNGP